MNVIDELKQEIVNLSNSIYPALIQIVKDKKELILDIQALDQFFNKGINNDKTKITPQYALSTKKKKRRRNLPFDRVILKDKANYEWITLDIRTNEFEIVARWDKFKYLRQRYGDKLLGLTDEALHEILTQLFIPEIERLYEQITIT